MGLPGDHVKLLTPTARTTTGIPSCDDYWNPLTLEQFCEFLCAYVDARREELLTIGRHDCRHSDAFCHDGLQFVLWDRWRQKLRVDVITQLAAEVHEENMTLKAKLRSALAYREVEKSLTLIGSAVDESETAAATAEMKSAEMTESHEDKIVKRETFERSIEEQRQREIDHIKTKTLLQGLQTKSDTFLQEVQRLNSELQSKDREIERLTNLSEKSEKERATLKQMLDERNVELKNVEKVAAMNASKLESQKIDLDKMKHKDAEIETLIQRGIAEEKRELEREAEALKEQLLQVKNLNVTMSNELSGAKNQMGSALQSSEQQSAKLNAKIEELMKLNAKITNELNAAKQQNEKLRVELETSDAKEAQKHVEELIKINVKITNDLNAANLQNDKLRVELETSDVKEFQKKVEELIKANTIITNELNAAKLQNEKIMKQLESPKEGESQGGMISRRQRRPYNQPIPKSTWLEKMSLADSAAVLQTLASSGRGSLSMSYQDSE